MILAILVLLSCVAEIRAAVPFQPNLRDYVHTAWTQHDGIPLSSIDHITQTTDGYLWFTSSEEGLLRFDGVRFVRVESPCGKERAIDNRPLSDGAGGLWIACGERLFHRQSSGRMEEVTAGPPGKAATCLVDTLRRLWFLPQLSPLGYLQPDGSGGPSIPDSQQYRQRGFAFCTEDSGGNIWMVVEGGLIRIRDDHAERILSGDFFALAPAKSGGIYALRTDCNTPRGGRLDRDRLQVRYRRNAGHMASRSSRLPQVFGWAPGITE